MHIILSLTMEESETLAKAAAKAKLYDVASRIKSCIEESRKNVDVEEKYREACRANHCRDGELECDDDAVVSIGNDKGAYVQTWTWVDDDEAGIESEDEDEEDE
jgi:hypothetical protein